ncbi:MAG: LpxI family protein [Kiritimatiellia bacterium]
MTGIQTEQLGIIAGKGVYPRILAASAKQQGVKRVFAVAFKGETDRRIGQEADEVQWIHIGLLGAMLEAFRKSGVKKAVMAGQITPTHLFNLRMDRAMLDLLGRLKERNADTIFGALAEELAKIGIELMPAYLFMESSMPSPGLLTKKAPADRERKDIELGLKVAKTTSGLEIGQTVVVKEGTILAVEAFEGTDKAIRRAGRLGGKGSVVVKVAKKGHDMRFDIPVIGMRTLKSLKKAGVSAMALEAGRTILLERERVIAGADRLGISMIAVAVD